MNYQIIPLNEIMLDGSPPSIGWFINGVPPRYGLSTVFLCEWLLDGQYPRLTSHGEPVGTVRSPSLEATGDWADAVQGETGRHRRFSMSFLGTISSDDWESNGS